MKHDITTPLFHGLSTRLLLWFLLLSLLPLAVLGFSSYYNAKISMQHEATIKLVSIARFKAQQLEGYFTNISKSLIALSRSGSVLGALPAAEIAFKDGGVLSQNYIAVERTYRPLLSHYAQTDENHDLFLISTDGDIVFTLAREKDLGTNLMTGPYQDSVLAKLFAEVMYTHNVGVSGFDFYKPSNKLAGFIATPVFKRNKLVGVLALQVNMNQINRLAIDYSGLGSTGETVLAARDANELMFLTQLRFDAQAAFKRTTEIGSTLALPMQQALQGSGGKGFSTDYRGVNVLAVWQYLPHTRLGMVIKMDITEAFADVDRLTEISLLIALLTVIAVIIAALFISKSLAAPIGRLTNAIRDIEHGDYSGRIKTDSSDEIGELATAFNSMADSLDHQRQQVLVKTAQIKKRSATLAAANEEIKSFAYIVSHDLRSPLVNMKGFSTELQFTLTEINEIITQCSDRLEPDEREEMLRLINEDAPESMQFISTSVDKMDNMLTAILKLSRFGRRELQFEDIDLKAVCNEMLNSLKHQIEAMQTQIHMEELPTIYNDRLVIEQIMGNLLGNAVKYLSPERPGEIHISSSSSNAGITITVSDNGYGIGEDEKDKVFQIFRRGKHTEMKGEGMGLAYVQTLVRAQDGNITFESIENEGSRFIVYLPINKQGKE